MPQVNRFQSFLLAAMLVYLLLLWGLADLWYGRQAQLPFHFFDDWEEWLGMDKLGHFFTAFHIGDLGVHLLGWLGMSRKKSIWTGSLCGLLFQAPIEIMDGFGKGYGFSWADMGANLAGSIFLLGQYLLWNEIRLMPRFSFHTTDYAAMRPSLLGNSFSQQLLKDYNGQTYWLSVNCWRFLRFPPAPWQALVPSVGYGIEGMVYGRIPENLSQGLQPISQYYFAADLDLSFFSPREKVFIIAFFLLNRLHLIGPALEYLSFQHGVVFHFLYF
jgi:uncharacterized protein YfiM (DUF2279 family)